MTTNYTAGEHVRIIKADPGFNDELGKKQVGLVGTVVKGTQGGGAFIKFPHYDGNLYFLSNEIEPVGCTPSPEPEKEYLFRTGDSVRYNHPNSEWEGSEFTVNEDVPKNADRYKVISLTITKATEAMKRFSHNEGSEVKIYLHKVEKFTAPKFKVGDWVKVTGRNDKYDGIVGTIDKKGWSKFWGVTGTDGEQYQFAEDKLEPTEEPYKSVFKAGDYAKLGAGYGRYSGLVFEVKEGDTTKGKSVQLNLKDPDGKVADWVGYFCVSNLVKAEKPAEPHWTESKRVGSLGQVKSRDGNPDRVLLKVSDTEWLHLYQTEENGSVGCGIKRDIKQTKTLMGHKDIRWKSDVTL